MIPARERRRPARPGARSRRAAAAALPATFLAQPRLGRPEAPRRVFRAATLAVLAVALGSAGHMLGGGLSTPPPAVLLGLAALIAAIAYGLSRREWRTGAIIAGLALGQAGVHLGSALSSAFAADSSGGIGAATALLCRPGASLAGTHGGGLGTIGLMACGHALATLACAVWLRGGEARLWRSLRGAARWLGGALQQSLPAGRLAPLLVPPAAGGRAAAACSAPATWISRTRPRRGPPLAALAT